jgi:CHAD domain-containing protein
MALLDYLDGADYQLFVKTFAALLSDVDNFPQDTATQEIRQVLPLILQKQVEKILSYEDEASSLNPSPSNLHQLRIACKRLRYTLEYFQTLFDPPVEALITMIKGMQDHLGQLQDAVVAGEMLKLYLIWGDWGEAATRRAYWADEPVIDPGTAQYLAWRQTECQNLLETFPQLWQQFKESEFQQTLDSALKGL